MSTANAALSRGEYICLIYFHFTTILGKQVSPRNPGGGESSKSCHETFIPRSVCAYSGRISGV